MNIFSGIFKYCILNRDNHIYFLKIIHVVLKWLLKFLFKEDRVYNFLFVVRAVINLPKADLEVAMKWNVAKYDHKLFNFSHPPNFRDYFLEPPSSVLF